MNTGLIRVRDFAQACGCTPQNIYGHLKTYAADLEGHTIQGKGRQGVLLDEFAQDFLRSVMYPKEIADNTLMEEINQLRGQLLQMTVKSTELAARLVETEGERDRALIDNKQYQKRLKASEEAEEAKDKELDQAKADKDAAIQAAMEARQELTDAHEAFEADLGKKDAAIRERDDKIQKWQKYAADLQQYHIDLAAYREAEAKYQKRWFKRGVKPPVPPVPPVAPESEQEE